MLYKTFRHFAVLVCLIVFATATLPCWSNSRLDGGRALYMAVLGILAFCLPPLFAWWGRTELYWNFHMMSRWSDLLGLLASLAVLTGELYGAWWVSGLAWFHLPALARIIFLLAMAFCSILWLTEAITDIVMTSRDIRQILRSPSRAKRGEFDEKR
jgi:hypothetical protein